MKEKVWLIGAVLVVLVALAAFYFWPKAAPTIANYPSAGTDLIAFGDSLVYGEGASEGHDFVSLLSAKIGEPIINLGVPGNTSAQGLARLSGLDKYHPKVVLLLLGGNDAIEKLPKAQTFANLAAIITDLEKRGAVALLLGVRGAALSDPYAGEFEKLASTYHTAYVSNVLDGLFGNPQYMSDEVHPNDAGYAIIAARILPVLQKLVK